MAQRKNAGSVVIKLDLRGQEELKRRLEELGPTGERVWRDLRRGAKPAEQGFKAVDAARQQLQGGVDELASRAGPLGQFLTSIGPWGLAAAAGLGVLALALREVFVLMERSRETAFWAEELENAAAAAGMMEDRVLSLGSAVQLAGGDFNAALAGLEEFSKRIGEYRATGQGEGRDAFDALGLRDLVDSGADATTVLDAVLERMREIQDPARRLAIADKLGLREAAPLLQRSADDMERILGAAENINAAFSEQVLQDFANAGEAIREAQLRQDRARQLQSLATVDLEVSRQQALARMEEARTAVGWNRVALEERSTEILEMQRDVMLRTIERVSSAPAQYAELGIHVADLRLELEQLNVALEEQARILRTTQFDVPTTFGNGSREILEAMQARWSADASRNEIDLERRRELEALFEQAYRATLTPVQELAQYEADLNAIREAGITIGEDNIEMTEGMVRQLVALRAEALGLHPKLEQLSEDERKLAGAIASTFDPLEAQKQLLEELTTPASEAADRLMRLFALWREAPEHADVIIAEIRAVKEALHGPEDDNEIRMESRFEGLRKMAEEYENVIDVLDRAGTDTLGGIHDGLVDIATTSGDVGDAFEDMGRRIMRTLADIAIQRYITGPLSGVLEGVFDSWTGGASGKTTTLPKHDTGASYRFKGNPGLDQNVLALNGRPFAQVSRNEDLHIIPALNTMGGRAGGAMALELPPLDIVLKDERSGGGKARASERRSADGGRQLQILLEENVGGLLGSGGFDAEMEARYGLVPKPGRR